MIAEHFKEDGSYEIEYMNGKYKIRPDMVNSLLGYALRHEPVGHFLQAVLSNNLFDAMTRADKDNFENLPAFVNFIYWEIPDRCWGSMQAYKDWIAEGRHGEFDT